MTIPQPLSGITYLISNVNFLLAEKLYQVPAQERLLTRCNIWLAQGISTNVAGDRSETSGFLTPGSQSPQL